MTLKANISWLFLAVLLVGGTWFERRVLREARAENQRLHAALQAGESSADRSEPVSNQGDPELKRELARLRNEVRKLRAEKPQLDQLRMGNELLLQRIAGASQARPAPTPEQGFVMSEAWANVGFATPEAAIQTFFWALRQQDVLALTNSLTPETNKKSGLVDEQTGILHPEVVEREIQMLGRISGYRIVTMEVKDDRAKAEVQAAVNGTTIKLSLRRIGQEWKMHNL